MRGSGIASSLATTALAAAGIARTAVVISAWRPSAATSRSALVARLSLSSATTAPFPPRSSTTTRMWLSSTAGTDTTDATATAESPVNDAPTTPAAVNVVPFVKPHRVVPGVLPKVYVYDHCPFCVRVRFALGVKNVKHTIVFMANDDVDTPTGLVGKKIAPILQWEDMCMAESMDIIHLLDADERLGPTSAIRTTTMRTDLKEWQASVSNLLRGLQRPRYVATGLLPEFAQLESRHAFISGHQLPGYEKAEWKEMDQEEKLALYGDAMAKDPADDMEELNRKLVELSDIIVSPEHCSEGGLSYDDVDLFARLRSITIISGVEWPAKLRQYMDHMAELSDVPLYDTMAL